MVTFIAHARIPSDGHVTVQLSHHLDCVGQCRVGRQLSPSDKEVSKLDIYLEKDGIISSLCN